MLRKEEAVKIQAAHRGTLWAFAQTLVTGQFVLGRRDFP